MKSFESLVGQTTRAAISEDRRIKQLISRIVPGTTLSHIEFCRLEGGRLRVTVDSAAWVARLRFCERQLIDALKKEKMDVHTVSLHVAPAEKPVARVTRREPNRGSARAAATLQSAAEGLSAITAQNDGSGERQTDDHLRQELLKLAAKLRER